MIHARCLLFHCLCLLVLLSPMRAGAGSATIAVAASFRAPLAELCSLYAAQGGQVFQLSSGSTGKLYAQIRQGAPYALFFAADTLRPYLLEEEGWITPEQRFPYARGVLALWSPRGVLSSEPALPPGGRLALANPALAPFGLAARNWLEERGEWRPNLDRFVYGENVAQAAHFIASGACPAGFVSLSLVPVSMWSDSSRCRDLSRQGAAPVMQQAVDLEVSERTRAFRDWLRGEEAAACITKWGFALP